MERHHEFANVITATVMARIWMKLTRKASRLDVSNGSYPVSLSLSINRPFGTSEPDTQAIEYTA
jgi:hypothetical protein